MAYPTTPKTWVAGDVLTAAQLNAELRDALLGAFPLGPPDVAWTSYTPTLTQSGAVTKTVSYAKYTRVGRLVVASCRLAVTGTGTAGQPVAVGLPVASVANDRPIGSFHLIDASAVLNYTGVALYEVAWAGAIGVGNAQSAGFGQAQFTAALASGDFVGYAIAYESLA